MNHHMVSEFFSICLIFHFFSRNCAYETQHILKMFLLFSTNQFIANFYFKYCCLFNKQLTLTKKHQPSQTNMIFNYVLPNGAQYPFIWTVPTPYLYPHPNVEFKEEEPKTLNSNQRNGSLSGSSGEISTTRNSQCQKPLESKIKVVKGRKKMKKTGQNEEYFPDEQVQSIKEKGKQNTLRNILPNIMHQTCTFVQKKSRSGHLVKKLLKSSSANNRSMERFYLYQGLIKQKNNHYINEDAFDNYSTYHEPEGQIFSIEEQKQYLRISRVLMRHFLGNELRVNVLTSNRMKAETKNGHLKILRRVIDKLSSTYHQ